MSNPIRITLAALSLALGIVPVALAQVGSTPAQPVMDEPAPARPVDDAERERAREAARASLPEAKRLLLDSAVALNSARTLRYTATHRIEGNLPIKLGSAEARVTMLKPEDQKYHWIMRAQGSGTLKQGEPTVPFDVAWFIDQTQTVDDAAKRVVVRRGRLADPAVRIAENVKLKEMFGPTPWNAELETATLAMAPDDEVGGVLCRVIEASYTSNRRTSRIWLGADDLLPRRFAHYVGAQNENAQYSAAMIVEFSNMEVEPKLTMSDVTVPAPEGYESEQFAIADRPSPEERAQVRSREDAKVNPSSDAKPGPQTERPVRRDAFTAAPDFTLQTADGGSLSLQSLRGSVVVLDFWGTWALQSKQSAPELQSLHEKFKGQPVRVIGLAVKERSEERPITVFKERGQTYTLVPSGDSAARAYEISTYPTVVVVGPAGELLLKVEKYVPGESINAIEQVVQKNIPAGNTAGEVIRPQGG